MHSFEKKPTMKTILNGARRVDYFHIMKICICLRFEKYLIHDEQTCTVNYYSSHIKTTMNFLT